MEEGAVVDEAEVPRLKAKGWEEEGVVDAKGEAANATLGAKMSTREVSVRGIER